MLRPRTEIWFRAGSVERGGVRYEWRDAFARLLPGNIVQYPWLTKREAQAESRKNNAGAIFFDTKEEAKAELVKRTFGKFLKRMG